MRLKTHSYSYLFILLFLISSFPLSATASERDSLENLLKNVENDLEKVDLLNELSFNYFFTDLSKSREKALLALKIAKEIDYAKGSADAQMKLGNLAQVDGAFQIAQEHYKKALLVRIRLGNKIDLANVYNSMGICEFSQDEFEEAIKLYQLGLEILANEPIERTRGSLHQNLADIYTYTTDYKLAITHFDSSSYVWLEIGNLVELANTIRVKGDFYLYLENWDHAEQSYEKALSIFESVNNKKGIANTLNSLGNLNSDLKKYDLALRYYEKAMLLADILEEKNQALINSNIATMYKHQKKYNKALAFFTESEQIFNKINSASDLASINYELGSLHQAQSNYSSAQEFYLKCLTFCKDDFDPFLKAQALLQLSTVSTQINQDEKAVTYLQEYNLIRDSIYYNRVDAINFQLNLEEERKINKDLQLTISKNENQSLWQKGLFALLFLGSLLASALGYAFFLNQKRQLAESREDQANQQRQLAEYKVDQANLEINDLLRTKELEMTYARIEAKDETQKQIGQDLHDRIGMMLSTVKLYLADFNNQLQELKIDTGQKQQKTMDLLDETVNEVRRISHDMQSGVLKKYGLASAVNELAEMLSDSNQIKAKVFIHGLKERFPNQIEFKIYKIIQELVGNVLKHAKASKLTISLHRQDNLLNLIVEDNGIGFDPIVAKDSGGLGLKSITDRVAQLNGRCLIESIPNDGTNVIIDIPLTDDPLNISI